MRARPGLSVRRLAIAVAFAGLGLPPCLPANAAPPLLANAASGRVTLLQPSAVNPRARRCLTRLREELEAGGFEVAISDFGVGGEALWSVDPPSTTDGALATITLLGNPDDGPAELWIVNGVPAGRALVRRLLVPAGAGSHDDEVLAVRALEFLRASALELAKGRSSFATGATGVTGATLASGPSRAAEAPLRSTAASATKAPASPSTTLAADAEITPSGPEPSARRPMALELGISAIESSRALAPAFLPVARLRAEWLSLLETRFTAAGFGTQPRFNDAKGTARVGHLLALLEVRAAFRSGHALRPSVGVGAGGLRVSVEGSGGPGYDGASGARWVGLFDAGAGVTARLSGWLSVAFEVHGQLAAPYPTVLFSGEEGVRIGRPALFSSLTLVTPL